MNDDLSSFKPLDPSRVNTMDAVEMKYWCKELQCTEGELTLAVAKVGGMWPRYGRCWLPCIAIGDAWLPGVSTQISDQCHAMSSQRKWSSSDDISPNRLSPC
jgi:hypothetical protein